MGTMGTPIMPLNASWSNFAPLASSSSYIFMAITILGLMSISSVVRYRLRSRLEATMVFTIMSGLSLMMCWRTYTSSGEYAERAYVPGRSVISIVYSLKRSVPRLASTVTPL